MGRWLSQDPLGMVNGPNMYAYCKNNPTNLIDPWGLETGSGAGSEDNGKCPDDQTPTNVDKDPMQDILDAYAWINQNYPVLTNGLDPAFFAVNLPPGYDAFYVGNGTVLIDPNYGSMDDLVCTIAHELMHARNGFFFTAFLQSKKFHDVIYWQSEHIRRHYINQ
ncbi:hypothetical protein KKG41_06675 [Patescibacteria group bacterium]|nr:hypothetical protein [Patescibacteria group bacterium]MBU1891124.1 hypothetical protein [Patescibacteria group bacterium]